MTNTELIRQEIENIALFPTKSADYNDGREDMKMMILDFIDSLPKEAPETLNGKFVFPKFLYARTTDNKTIDVSYAPQSLDATEYIRSDSLQQEQPEVDLEKFTEKIKTFQGRYKHLEIASIKGAMAFMARMFYQYPNTARQWYVNLPKATMD